MPPVCAVAVFAEQVPPVGLDSSDTPVFIKDQRLERNRRALCPLLLKTGDAGMGGRDDDRLQQIFEGRTSFLEIREGPVEVRHANECDSSAEEFLDGDGCLGRSEVVELGFRLLLRGHREQICEALPEIIGSRSLMESVDDLWRRSRFFGTRTMRAGKDEDE